MPAQVPALPIPACRRPRLAHILVGCILLLLAGAALKATMAVTVPVVLALFIALIVQPLDSRIARALPDRLAWLGQVAVLVLLLVLLGAFVAGLGYAAERLVSQLGALSEQLRDLLPDGPATPGGQSGAEAGQGVLSQVRAMLGGAGGSLGKAILSGATAAAGSVANATTGMIAGILVTLFLVLLALAERELWHDKLVALAGPGGAGRWERAIDTLAATLRRFLVVRTIIGAVSAAALVAWLALFGVDLLLVWAVLTFLPNIGAIISGVLLTVYAFLTKDPLTALAIAAGVFVIAQVIGNLLDPVLQGRAVALSPLVIVVALLLWGWIWGTAGAFLAVPMTIAVVIVCATVPALRPVAVALSNQPTGADLDRALGWDAPG
jgi:AI-2 transport protein TqsA